MATHPRDLAGEGHSILKNEGPLPKMLSSPADGTNVSLPLGCKSLVRPVVENLFTNHANGPGSPPALVPSLGLFYIFQSGPSFFRANIMR